MPFLCEGYSAVGYKREDNEDFLFAQSLDSNNDILLTVIADGAGSQPSKLQPAQIASRHVFDYINRVYQQFNDKKYFLENASMFLKEATMIVNSILGSFRTANEEVYSGFSCSLTCVLFYKDDEDNPRMSFAHSGNTRLYMIRRSNDGNAIIRQLTKDHTEAQILVDENKMTEEQYYFSDLRNKLLCPLGMFEKPKIDTADLKIKKEFMFLLSTDGIHYAINTESLARLVLSNENMYEACKTLCDAALNLQYNDDYCALLVKYV